MDHIQHVIQEPISASSRGWYNREVIGGKREMLVRYKETFFFFGKGKTETKLMNENCEEN